MRYGYHSHGRKRRLYVSAGTLLLYLLLVAMDLARTFTSDKTIASSFTWVYFSSSCVIALLFLAIGNLVWLYARRRIVALLLFCFSLMMMITFAIETGAFANDPLLSILGDVSSQLALFFLAVLLLRFPRNYFTWSTSHRESVEEKSVPLSYNLQYYWKVVLRGYVIILFLWSIISAGLSAILYIFPAFYRQLPQWVMTVSDAFPVVATLGILLTIVISYRQSVSERERLQRRLLVIGILSAIMPVLVLTLLPPLLGWSRYVIDPRVSTLTLVLLPLALGYAILRYQVLVFDTYIRRVIAWIVGGMNLVMLIYLAIALSSLFLPEGLLRVICLAIGLTVFAPLVWYLAHLTTEKVFFSENVHYQRLVSRINRVNNETIDLQEAARLLTQAAINVLETPEACLFVLDEDSGHYLLSSSPAQSLAIADSKDTDEFAWYELARTVKRAVDPVMHGNTRIEFDGLGADAPVLVCLEKSSRPLQLSEAVQLSQDGSLGLSRYLRSTGHLGVDPLLVPVRVQGRMIAVLVLGLRGDKEHYAGPDFETIELILSRFASLLENARLYAQASRHVAILNTLYSASAMLSKAFLSMEEVALAYARIAAEATQATAVLWLYDEQANLLRRIVSVGGGPFFTGGDVLPLPQDFVWASRFYEGASEGEWKHIAPEVSAFFSYLLSPTALPTFPLAWIPFSRGQQHLGVLVLNYPRPHIFSEQEKRVLEIFASQCAAALENTRMTSELRAAYERQQELDRLKDQFIITASHELRTPLTAVMGYIELLGEYGASLSPETLADFIAKAHRGCDELTLMVGNIMDAGRVQVDAGKIRLGKVPLGESVKHVLEIMEAMTRREHRTIQVDVPEQLLVEADDLRLRQVLLNLVNNALKYSPAGSSIAITAAVEERQVVVSVRDYGSGVPPEERERLFERFMRLERDMNSPVRGAGLGLYICKQLVEAMGGHIWVESTGIAGEGSTFSFTLHAAAVTVSEPLPYLS